MSKPSSASASNSDVVTIEMVAKRAGVSLSTVSRILNGTAVVSEDKKRAVDEAIAKLGFVPNPLARSLAGGRSLSIGVITRTIDSPFYGTALRGVEETLAPRGYSALFVSGHFDTATEKRCFELLRARRVDGIIVLTGSLPDQALKAYAKTTPLVVTGRKLKAPKLFSLDFDNFEGGRLAAEHLVQLGHTRIAVVAGESDHRDSTERLRGFQSALMSAGLAFDPNLVVPGDYLELGGARAVEQLLAQNRPFTAIFAINDQMAAGAALALHRRGLRIPEDCSIVGFDDLRQSLFALPPLTTIHQPAYELGQLAAQSMLQLLSGEQPSAQEPGPRLIVRESTRSISP